MVLIGGHIRTLWSHTLWSHNVYYGLSLLVLETHTNQELPMVCVVIISASRPA